MWEKGTMVSIEARWTTATEEGCSRGVTFKLGRFWPTLVGKASSRTEAEADTLIDCTGGAAEADSGWEESIGEGEKSFKLFRALIPSWE